MSSGDIEFQPTAGKGGSILPVGITRKWKIIIGAAFLLGAVAIVGVCATAVSLGVVTGTQNGRSGSEEGMGKEARSLNDNGRKEVSCICYARCFHSRVLSALVVIVEDAHENTYSCVCRIYNLTSCVCVHF